MTFSSLTVELQTIVKEQQFDMNNPGVIKACRQLELLLEWASMHESVLERNKTRKFFGYQFFIGNSGYA